MMDNSHDPGVISGQFNVMGTYLKGRYQLSDLLRDRKNNRMLSISNRWLENKAPDKGVLEEDSYKTLKQF